MQSFSPPALFGCGAHALEQDERGGQHAGIVALISDGRQARVAFVRRR
jgi:hypothetical protein